MSDDVAECETLGCEGTPVEGGYCAECLDISPGVLDADESAGSPDTAENEPRATGSSERDPPIESGQTAFADAAEWFHSQLDREIPDHTDEGEHPGRPTTAREYFHERGWTDATLDEALLGYAPATATGLLDHLMREGYGREAILGTGLFTEDLRPLWQGRYVLPYFDEDGQPVYAISRATGDEGGGAVGYDGHPDDGMSGKYAKPAHTKEYAHVEEPIFGLGSVEDGQPVLITEGIADAITAQQAGYPCLSPVTTRFKHGDRERLVEVLNAHDTPRAYVVGDAEPAGSDLDDEGRLALPQGGEGLRGALDTAAHLARNDVEARVAELPRPGPGKVDLDGYLREWTTTLAPVLASAKPAREHPAYDPQDAAVEAARTAQDRAAPEADGDTGEHSALFDLDLRDVASVGEGYRGPNPLGHHGESENYTVTVGDGRDGVLYDHKHKAAYNALTYLLVEAGERRAESPGGRLDDGEVLAAWVRAKGEGLIPEDDPIPHRALRHVALDGGLCESGDVEDGWRLPVEAYNRALDAVREEHDLDPGRRPLETGTGDGGEPVSALPLAQLDALSPHERRRAAKKRGAEWPDTDEARERLFQTVTEVMHHEDSRVVDAPTSLGKSHTIAATPWDSPQYENTTGDRPVVHLSKTRQARDEAVRTAEDHGDGCFVLLGRHEACPIAAAQYDPENCEGQDRRPITVDGEPASQWIDAQCEGKGIPFSVAHTKLKNRMDQDRELPCCTDGERCRAIVQWEDLRDGDHALIEATHNFARVPGLRMHTNLVFDEEPDFASDLTTDRVRRMITALLKEIDAPVQTWETFIGLVMGGYGGDAGREADELGRQLEDASPDTDWYFDDPDAHTLAPALARGIYYAEERGNGRIGATTSHEPPRLDAQASDDDGWNREWVRIVLDEDNEVQTVRTSPDLNLCRSVVGLDAHPSMPIWQANTKPDIGKREVLDPPERQLWRRYERGLRVVQVGDATRPYASGEYFGDDGTAAMLEHLREEYGPDFRTAITAASVEQRTQELMRENGIPEPETMHYGEEKSRNDFADESVGLVNGSIDPGDEFVVNLLAELDLDAEPETTTNDDGEEYRAHGRGFVGEDAETAAEILASVRENHVAQSAGRYARDPDDPEATATVFVRTDAIPVAFADVQVPGVEWVFSEQQRTVVEALRERERPASAKEIAREADVSKGHTQRTLKRLAENSAVQRFEGEGDWGADLYAETGLPTSGVVSTGEGSKQITYGDSSTWSVSISPPTATATLRDESSESKRGEGNVWWSADRSDRAGERGDKT